MRFSSFTIILMTAGASFGLAAPAEASSDNSASTDSAEWTCANGWTYCGVCNGSSCKIGAINFSCIQGSCAGSEGGDGKVCGYVSEANTQCPGY